MILIYKNEWRGEKGPLELLFWYHSLRYRKKPDGPMASGGYTDPDQLRELVPDWGACVRTLEDIELDRFRSGEKITPMESEFEELAHMALLQLTTRDSNEKWNALRAATETMHDALKHDREMQRIMRDWEKEKGEGARRIPEVLERVRAYALQSAE